VRIHNIRLAEEDAPIIVVRVECVACGKIFTTHGRNDSGYFNREVYELRCPSCKYQDRPSSPCPECDARPELRVVE
jgi:primosomal protein N'